MPAPRRLLLVEHALNVAGPAERERHNQASAWRHPVARVVRQSGIAESPAPLAGWCHAHDRRGRPSLLEPTHEATQGLIEPCGPPDRVRKRIAIPCLNQPPSSLTSSTTIARIAVPQLSCCYRPIQSSIQEACDE